MTGNGVARKSEGTYAATDSKTTALCILFFGSQVSEFILLLLLNASLTSTKSDLCHPILKPSRVHLQMEVKRVMVSRLKMYSQNF